jgi:MoxR-like ATPase
LHFKETNMTQAIQDLRSDLSNIFPERREVIDGALCAILTREHVLLLGPPGTAKSALVRAIARAFGGSYFETLLTKFTTPEEIFGPISLKALEQDRFMRVTTGKLPEAQFGFVDEIFKASSAILNTLLTVANERVFHNDGLPVPCPLVSLFGASNELPDGKDLEALFDRFAVRFNLPYLLRETSMKAMLRAPDPVPSLSLDMATLEQAQWATAKIKVTDATIDALIAIREACRADGIVASDRRWKRSLKVAQASAYLAGEKQTGPEDLVILTDSLWREPKDRPKVARIVGKLSDPVAAQATEVLDAARETAQKVASLQAGDRKSYISSAAQAIDAFGQQQRRLSELAKSAGKRAKAAIADANADIAVMHGELARAVSAGLGLGVTR